MVSDLMFVHPSQLSAAVRRDLNASVYERLSRAHRKVAEQGIQTEHQLACAESASRAAQRIRDYDETAR